MGFTVNAARYLNTYEAYRLPAGSSVPEEDSDKVIKEDEDGVLILTDQAKKQMEKDRKAYSDAMQAQMQLVAAEQNEESAKKYAEDMAKIFTVFRNMAKGDIVAPSDERKLMEYDADLYQTAKMAQMMAQRQKAKEHDSEWDEDEEKARQEKIDALNEESSEMVTSIGSNMQSFGAAQTAAVVEVDSGQSGVAIDVEV